MPPQKSIQLEAIKMAPDCKNLGILRWLSQLSTSKAQEANDSDTDVNIDGDSGLGAEDELETAPCRRRPRVTEYISRRRNHGEPRDLVEGEDYNLTDLHEPDLRVRDHPPPPPPELLYESFEDALAGNWPSIQLHAQPLTTATSISGPQLGAPSTPIDIDADELFGFPIPARQYSWAGCSML
ncbi:hypothetical protein E4U38_004088 [Claviceps purpurea]|nr:hypothetical protein E4U38_004088 [Claviceps purpurea]